MITKKIGNVTYKRVEEDFSKSLTQITGDMEKLLWNIKSVLMAYESPIIGEGFAVPVEGEKVSEEIGNEIAFRKAKLNANIKKYHILKRIEKLWEETPINSLKRSLDKIEKFIDLDQKALKKYNPNFKNRI